MFTPSRERNTDPARPALPRLRWVMAAGALCWAVLVGRLVQVQGFRHAEYAVRAEQQHVRPVELRAKRGSILDRRGDELALDIQTATFYADPAMVDQPDEVARHFAPFSKDPEAHINLPRQLRGPKRFVYLARQLDLEGAARARQQCFNGVYEISETKRYCPSGALAAQLIGYTNIDNQGNEGVEMACDALLGGTKGAAVSYVDARGAQIPGRQEEHKTPGRQHRRADHRWGLPGHPRSRAERGAAQLRRGERPGHHHRAQDRRDPGDGQRPLLRPGQSGGGPAWMRRNRVVTDPFEPGSTFKAITAAVLLTEEAVSTEERVFCENGRFRLSNGDIVRDSHPLGWLSFHEVIGQSSNIGTMKMARRLKRKQFYEYHPQLRFRHPHRGRTALGERRAAAPRRPVVGPLPGNHRHGPGD